jgi:hypothetical protein
MMEPRRPSHITKQKTGPDDPELQATLHEALSQVSPEDVIAIADELAERRVRLFQNLASGTAKVASSFADLAAAVTHTRANAVTLTNYFVLESSGLPQEPAPALQIFDELLAGEAAVPVRVAAFVHKLNAIDTRLALELATGLLHNVLPKDNWLWTRWLWDPTTGTGILPLLAGSSHNLLAANIADGYSRVGVVTAMSVKFGEGTGLWTDELLSNEKRAAFANSAFLACAYSVYMYGSTSWRLSRDFNELLPSLPNMARRLLGLPKVKD